MDDTLTRDRSGWQAQFDELTLGRQGQAVTIEVLDEELGDQTEASGLPLAAIGYDPRGDVVVVSLKGRADGSGVVLRHLVHGPRSVDVLEREGGALVLRLVDAAGVETLLHVTPVR